MAALRPLPIAAALPAVHFSEKTPPAAAAATTPWLAATSLLRPSLQGFSLGGGLQWQLGPRISVVTGLQYTFLRQVPVAHAGWGLRAEEMDVSASTSFQDSSGLSWAQPLRSHWLEVPLGIACRLGQRGSLAAGLQLSRAIGLRIPLGWQLTDYQLGPATLINTQQVPNTTEWFGSSASTKVVATSEVRAWQLGGWLRYDYLLGRQLALSASLRYGNGRWVDTRPQPLSTVYLGLGLCYQFR